MCPTRTTHKSSNQNLLTLLLFLILNTFTMANAYNSPDLSTSLLGNSPSNNNLYHEEYKPAWLPALVLFPPVLPFFWKYHVDITEDDLIFGYSSYLSRKRVDRTKIISAEPFEIRPMRHWGGWGIRLRLGKLQTGYIAKGGPGVKLTLTNRRNKESVYVFSCEDPDTVCAILSQTEPAITIVNDK